MDRRAALASLVAVPVLAAPVLALPVLALPGVAVSSGAGTDPCVAPTITGTAGDDVLRGTAGPDVVAGLGGDDVIAGLGGDDVLCGGPGTDQLSGGDGADRLHGGADGRVAEDNDYYVFYGDTLAGGPGDDLLDLGDDPRAEGSDDLLSFVDSASGVILDLPTGTATGEGTDQVVGVVERVLGSDHDDVLVGTDADETLFGYDGSDHIDGGGGDDQVNAASSYDTGTRELSETTGNVLVGGAGNDELQGSEGDDDLRGGPGRDNLLGDVGLDRLRGGPGPDLCSDSVLVGDGQLLSGGPGEDDLELFFSPGGHRALRDVVVRVDLGAGTARATSRNATFRLPVPGFESVSASYGKRWYVRGTEGPDHISTSREVPIVARGLGGDDRLYGSWRDDVLDGGRGHDRASGYAGDDRYVAVERIFR